MSETVISIWAVSTGGAASLLVANVPFSNLQWTRRLSTCGEFAAQLVGALPAPWPGRYLLTRSDRPEVGVIEKVEASEGPTGISCSASGRFAECLLDRRAFGPGGGSVTGASWRQAVTSAFAEWPMSDAPAIEAGAGTEARSGSSYALRADEGGTAMEAVYAVTAAQGAYPVLSIDWEAGALSLSIVDGLDRTRAQSDRPAQVFSLEMATAASTSYCGDYSVARSSVIAHASAAAEGSVPVVREVDVPGFDPTTMWESTAAEDVSSLCSDEPTAGEVDAGGALRAYDHMAAVEIEMEEMGSGYGSRWDLADTCEVDVPAAGVSGTARIEEVREVVKESGATLEVSLGTKRISRVSRAMMRLR